MRLYNGKRIEIFFTTSDRMIGLPLAVDWLENQVWTSRGLFRAYVVAVLFWRFTIAIRQ